MKQMIIKFNENTKLKVGEYFRAYKSRYFTLVKEIAENQRNFDPYHGEHTTTLVKVDIFNKEEKDNYDNFLDMLYGKFGKSIVEKFVSGCGKHLGNQIFVDIPKICLQLVRQQFLVYDIFCKVLVPKC